jgi:hypothetical protein
MGMLRAIRLLNAVEGGTHSGAQLQTSLTDGGRLAEFKVLLSMRGQARRIAASGNTVTAIVASPIAREAVFAEASTENSIASQAIIANSTAVGTVSTSLATLTVIEANPISWFQFTGGAHYETNVKNVVETLAGTAPFASMSLLIANGPANNLVSNSRPAMEAVVASSPTVALMANSGSMMSDVAADATSIAIVAGSSSAMAIVAQNTIAMGQITPSAVGMSAISASPVAMSAIYNDGTAWTNFRGSGQFSNVRPAAIVSLAGLIGAFPSVNSIIDSSSELGKVVANPAAAQLMATDTTAMLYLATSPNLSLVFPSNTIVNAIAAVPASIEALAVHGNLTVALTNPILATAIGGSLAALNSLATHANFALVASNAAVMSAFAGSATAITSLIGNAGNFAIALSEPVAIGALAGSNAAMTRLIGATATDADRAAMFGSTAAKGAIFNSTVAVDKIRDTAATITWLKANGAVITTGTTVPNAAGRVGLADPFGGGVPAKILMLTANQVGIAAIPTAYTYGAAVAGSDSGATLSLIGAAALAPQNPGSHVATYQNLTVITAAGIIAITGVSRITYYNMG